MKVKTTQVSSITTRDATESKKKDPSQSIKILDLEIARNTPESQVWASGPVTTLIPRFSLGEEYHLEDHDSSLFCALKRKTHQYQFQLANVLQKKGCNNFFLATRECLFGKPPSRSAILLVWVVRVSSRRSLRTGPLGLRSCKWPSRFSGRPCAVVPVLSGISSSPSRRGSSTPYQSTRA